MTIFSQIAMREEVNMFDFSRESPYYDVCDCRK